MYFERIYFRKEKMEWNRDRDVRNFTIKLLFPFLFNLIFLDDERLSSMTSNFVLKNDTNKDEI